MRLLIDIPKEIYDQIINSYQGSTVRPKDYEIAIINGTPIPDNVSNGDVIRAMFPNTSLHINEMSHTVWVGYEEMSFRIDWWNSPYQKGE